MKVSLKKIIFLFLAYCLFNSTFALAKWSKEVELPNPIFEDTLSNFTVIASSRRIKDKDEITEIEREKNQKRRKEVSPLRNQIRISGSLQSYREMLANGENEKAAIELYRMSRSKRVGGKKKNQARYLLGVSLMNLGLMEVASYQFLYLIKKSVKGLVSPSLEKLQIVADVLGDERLISYAFNKERLKTTTKRVFANSRDMVFFRKGQVSMNEDKYKTAAKYFSRVSFGSRYYYKSQYNAALSLAKIRNVKAALAKLNSLIRVLKDEIKEGSLEPNSDILVNAELARARVLYQNKNWDGAIEEYRKIPRDSVLWHDALFEQTWAYLMGAKFRSALSNFHSLHSPYYEDFFQPESLILRSIVYLYICNYQEMDKALNLFDKIYLPEKTKLKNYLAVSRKSSEYFSDFNKYVENKKGPISKVVASHLKKDGEIKRNYMLLANLAVTKEGIKNFSSNWKSSKLHRYSIFSINKKIKSTEKAIGRKVRGQLKLINESLISFSEQKSLLKFEQINGKKENLKKRISGRLSEKKNIDDGQKRDFYIQNGYEYWPFKNEYWLDEIGNYHFLGVKSCVE